MKTMIANKRRSSLPTFGAVLSSALLVASIAHTAGAQGPGSISGFGSDFAGAASNGTASYSIAIAVPPGAGGLAPELALSYDGGNGVSEIGLGFELDLPRIRIRTENGLPRFDGKDAVEITGFGATCDLLTVGAGTFRPAFESGQFVRVTRSGDHWEARDKAGSIYRFGGVGHVEAEGKVVAAWLLAEHLDVFGHRIRYTWDATGGYARLTGAVWNDYGATVQNALSLSYEDRPDTQTLYSTGIKRTLDKRLKSVDVTHGGDLVRRYLLTYADAKGSQLASVQMVGRDGKSGLPKTTFVYTPTSVTQASNIVDMAGAPGMSPNDPGMAVTDLDGDGLPDLLVARPGHFRSYVNRDGKSWFAGVDWGAARSPSTGLDTPSGMLADLDADGAADLIGSSGQSTTFYRGLDATTFGPAVTMALPQGLVLDALNTRTVDMNGDGRDDFVTLTPSALTILFNQNGRTWASPVTLPPLDPAQAISFADPRTSVCDINGDGVMDICFLRSGALLYYVGRGYGAFEAPAAAKGVPAFDPASPWEIVDLDGDGWADLVHVGVNQVQVALAKAAGEFDEAIAIANTPPRASTTSVRFADMNGTGTADILWVDTAGTGKASWKYLELFPTGRGGLLSSVANGLGSVTRYSYGAAAQDAAAAREAGRPWASRADVAMPVLKRIEVDNSLGDPLEVTELTYYDGTYSPRERMFGGFASITRRRLGDAYAPTLITATGYDLGLVDRNLRGRESFVETKDEGGYVFSRRQMTFVAHPIAAIPGRESLTVLHSYEASELVTIVEGTDESRARTTLTEWEEDDLGNLIATREWGEVRGDDTAVGHDERITLRTYANNTEDWIVGLPASQEVQDAAGQRVAMDRFYYDGKAFKGLPLGSVARGTLTRHEAWVGPAMDAFELVSSSSFDADGHTLETRDARGGGVLMTWDPEDHTFQRSAAIKLDGGAALTKGTTYDRAFALVTEQVSVSGQKTTFAYDVFGRLSRVVAPGDSSELPTMTQSYDVGTPLTRIHRKTRVRSGQDDVEQSESVVDGAGRARAQLLRCDDGQWTLSGVGLWNAAGGVRKQLYAGFVNEAGRANPPLTADDRGVESWTDALGRVVRSRTPMGRESRVAFAPFSQSSWDYGQGTASSSYAHEPVIASYDGLGRVVGRTEIQEGKALSSKLEYDAAGRLMARTDAEGALSRYTYDGRGRRVGIEDPDLGTRAFAYDATGRLIEEKRPGVAARRWTYDLAGRLTSLDFDGDDKADVEQVWDQVADMAQDSYGLGNLVRRRDPSGSRDFRYDERGRITARRDVVGKAVYITKLAYDAQDRPVLRTFADGSSIGLRYDGRGLLSAYGKLVTFEHDAAGLETIRKYDGGTIETFGYDEDQRRTSNKVIAANGKMLQALAWTLDEADQVVATADKRSDLDALKSRSETYAYDSQYRLTSASGAWGKVSFGYSHSGNMISRTSKVDALNDGARTFGADGHPHALASARDRTMTYDDSGRMLSDGTRHYTWNANDELVQIDGENGASVESTFDGAESRRIRVQTDDGKVSHTTHFIDAWSEARDGVLVRYLVADGRRIVRLGPSKSIGDALTMQGDDGAAVREKSQPATGSKLAGTKRTMAVTARVTAALLEPSLVHAAGWLLFLLLALVVASGGAGTRQRVRASMLVLALPFAIFGCGGDRADGTGGAGEGTTSDPAGSLRGLSADDRIMLGDVIGSLTEVVSPDGTAEGSFATYPYGTVRYDTTQETYRYAAGVSDDAVAVVQLGARSYAPDLAGWTSGEPDMIEKPVRLSVAPFAEANAFAYVAASPIANVDPTGHNPPKGNSKPRHASFSRVGSAHLVLVNPVPGIHAADTFVTTAAASITTAAASFTNDPHHVARTVAFTSVTAMGMLTNSAINHVASNHAGFGAGPSGYVRSPLSLVTSSSARAAFRAAPLPIKAASAVSMFAAGWLGSKFGIGFTGLAKGSVTDGVRAAAEQSD